MRSTTERRFPSAKCTDRSGQIGSSQTPRRDTPMAPARTNRETAWLVLISSSRFCASHHPFVTRILTRLFRYGARSTSAVWRHSTITASAGLFSLRHHRARPGDLHQHRAATDHRVEPGDDVERHASRYSIIVARCLSPSNTKCPAMPWSFQIGTSGRGPAPVLVSVADPEQGPEAPD